MSELVQVSPGGGLGTTAYRFVRRQQLFTDDDGSLTVYFDTTLRPHMIRAWIFDRSGSELMKSFETQAAAFETWGRPGVDGFRSGVWQLHWDGRLDTGEKGNTGMRAVEIAVYVRPKYVPGGTLTSDASVIETAAQAQFDPASTVNGLLQLSEDAIPSDGSGSPNLPGGSSQALILGVVAVVAGGVVLSMRKGK